MPRTRLLLLLLLCPLVMAMGLGDSNAPTRIPEPQSDYRGLVVDQEGTRVDLTQLAVDGQTFVLGGLGQGQAAVPFDKVRLVELFNQGGALKARVSLDQGAPVELAVDGNLKLTGRTSFGNFRIPLAEVRSIEIKGLAR
ncbi:MAG: hypothetical protein ACOZHQ_06725 [Thermodesulfobacteriota bacterium]